MVRRLLPLLAIVGTLLVSGALRAVPFSWWVPEHGFVGDDPEVDAQHVYRQVADMREAGSPLHVEDFYYPPLHAVLATGLGATLHSLGLASLDPIRAARLVAILFSTATVLVVFRIGREIGGPLAAHFAAVAFGTTMLSVFWGGMAKPESLEAFFSAAALYCLLRSAAEPRTATLVLLGVHVGLAFSAKLLSLFLFHLPLVVRFARRREDLPPTAASSLEERSWRLLAVVAGVAGVTAMLATVSLIVGQERVFELARAVYDRAEHDHDFDHHLPTVRWIYSLLVAGTGAAGLGALGLAVLPRLRGESAPRAYGRERTLLLPGIGIVLALSAALGIFVALNANAFFRALAYRRRISGDVFDLERLWLRLTESPFHYPSYALSILPESVGLPLFLLALAGLIAGWKQRSREVALVVASFLPGYLCLELVFVPRHRFALFLMPALASLAGFGAAALVGGTRTRPARAAVSAIVVVAIAYSAAYSLAFVKLRSPSRDPRAAAARWIADHDPASPVFLFGRHEEDSNDHHYGRVLEVVRDHLVDRPVTAERFVVNDFDRWRKAIPADAAVLGGRTFAREAEFRNLPTIGGRELPWNRLGAESELLHEPWNGISVYRAPRHSRSQPIPLRSRMHARTVGSPAFP